MAKPKHPLSMTEEEIKKLPDLKLFRNEIDEINEHLMLHFKGRSELPYRTEMYSPYLDEHSRKGRYAVDDVDAVLFLHPIYSRIIKKEYNRRRKITDEQHEQIVKHDFVIAAMLRDRTQMGRPVATWKYHHTNSEKVEYKDRENAILNQVSELAKVFGLDPDATKEVFLDIIIKRTIGIEHCVMEQLKQRNNQETSIISMTCCEDTIPVLVSNAKLKHGEGLYKVKTVRVNGAKTYGIYKSTD